MVLAVKYYTILNKSFVNLKRILGSAYRMNMSVQTIINPDINNTSTELCKGNKRVADESQDESSTKIQKTERIKRKNHAMLLGYLGRDFFGMQINRGTKTIEEELINAMLKADVIVPEAAQDLHLIRFQRAARTDKGVSALRQIVSLHLPDNVDRSMINQHLPKEIRVFGLKRVTRGFNSKNQCDARTYKYVIPTFAFAPDSPELLKTPQTVDVDERIEKLTVIDGKPYTEYRLSSESLDKLNSVLKVFEGSHKYHNYTSKMTSLDPSSRRYILYFTCAGTFVSEGIEFAILEIKGQSFMLHQIRKMVSMTVAVLRNIVTEETLHESFQPAKYDIPIAPGLGLYLNYVHYDYYNRRYGTDGVHEMLDWKELDEEILEFQKQYILKHIVDTESSEKTTLNWLGLMARHTFSAIDDSTEETNNDL